MSLKNRRCFPNPICIIILWKDSIKHVAYSPPSIQDFSYWLLDASPFFIFFCLRPRTTISLLMPFFKRDPPPFGRIIEAYGRLLNFPGNYLSLVLVTPKSIIFWPLWTHGTWGGNRRQMIRSHSKTFWRTFDMCLPSPGLSLFRPIFLEYLFAGKV